METATALRSFHCSSGSISQTRTSLEKPGLTIWPTSIRYPLSSSVMQAGTIVSYSNKPEATVSSKSIDLLEQNGSAKKHALRSTTFPSAFKALVTEVCDETSVAELQIKIGDFEMHMKRNIGSQSAPIVSAPSVLAEPAPSSPSTSAPKVSSEKPNPFSAFAMVSSKLARLEASGITGYKVVPSPTVGSFTSRRTVKGKKQPPVCKQVRLMFTRGSYGTKHGNGDVIKEGQVIGYVDQFGAELPVKSDSAGEILKLLFDEGEAVGYGDPLVAILPSLS